MKKKTNYKVFDRFTGRTTHAIRVKNSLQGRKLIVEWRKALHSTGIRLIARGRHSDRKQLFAQVGRKYSTFRANQNDIYFGSPEGQLCDEFMVYLYVPKGKSLPFSVK